MSIHYFTSSDEATAEAARHAAEEEAEWVHHLGFRVYNLGFKVYNLGFRVRVLGPGVWGLVLAFGGFPKTPGLGVPMAFGRFWAIKMPTIHTYFGFRVWGSGCRVWGL